MTTLSLSAIILTEFLEYIAPPFASVVLPLVTAEFPLKETLLRVNSLLEKIDPPRAFPVVDTELLSILILDNITEESEAVLYMTEPMFDNAPVIVTSEILKLV